MGGWTSRLKTGLAKVLNVNEPLSHGTHPRYSSNIDVNEIKFAMSGFSQPVYGPELSTVGAYSREGYTSKTFITPSAPFSDQVYYVQRDEDVQIALNRLASQITGGEHYWKSEYETIQDHLTQFSTDIDFDWMDTILVKELLAYGNSVWKPRLGIAHIRNREDLLNIPISSFVRIWLDRQRIPYKYEFRGSDWQGYHNMGDVMHFSWNPVNGSLFGTGFMTALVSTRDFDEITPSGLRPKRLPSLMDRKYSTTMNMHLTERRYTPHNVYQAPNASADERSQLSADVADLETGEDIVVGNKVEVTELGTSARAFNPTQFSDLTQGAIFKALNYFGGKQGSESSHQYANAKTSAEQDEIGLASFPLAVTRQLIEKLFQPWYEQNGGSYDMMYGGGMVAVPWKEANPELNFGRVQKKDLDTKDMIALIQLAVQTGAVQDPVEIRKLVEDAGLGLTKEMTEQMNMMYNPQGAVYPPNFNTYPADQSQRPMDSPNYTSSQRDASPSQTNSYDPQPSKINFTSLEFDTEEDNIKSEKEKLKLQNQQKIQEMIRKLEDE